MSVNGKELDAVHEVLGDAAGGSVSTELPITRQDLAVIQFLDRMDRLYRDVLGARERELLVKDRLIGELERRALQAEENATLLKEYIAGLPPEQPSGSSGGNRQESDRKRRGWRFWR